MATASTPSATDSSARWIPATTRTPGPPIAETTSSEPKTSQPDRGRRARPRFPRAASFHGPRRSDGTAHGEARPSQAVPLQLWRQDRGENDGRGANRRHENDRAHYPDDRARAILLPSPQAPLSGRVADRDER